MFKMKKRIEGNERVARWFGRNSRFLSILVLTSGSLFSALDLTSSKIFGLNLFNCGLTNSELSQFSDLKFVFSVLFENIPQLGIQMWFLSTYGMGKDSNSLLFALLSSTLSIAHSFIGYLLFKAFDDPTS